MIITTQQKRRHLDKQTLDCKLGETDLQSVHCEKILGTLVDENLTWKQHCDKLFKKVNSSIALLRRIKQFLPMNMRKLFYNSYILPHLDYCCHLWGASPFMNRLYRIQKCAIRVLCDARYNASTENLFKTMYIMPLPDRIFYKNICMVFKCLSNLTPQYMESLFTEINHGRATRL